MIPPHEASRPKPREATAHDRESRGGRERRPEPGPSPKVPAVKICGLTRPVDARVAGAARAEYLGAVLLPGTPRAVSPQTARRLAEAGGGALVLVTVDMSPSALVEAARTSGASVIQLHGTESPEDARWIGEGGPWHVWKGVRVRSAGDLLRGLDRFHDSVQGLVLDAWHPNLPGGTGTSFSWEEIADSREVVSREAPELEVVVAGGLTPENVVEVRRLLRPDVVDVSSGVERRPGVKDRERVVRFIERARAPAPSPRGGSAEGER